MPADTDVARLVELTEAAAFADLLRAAPADWGCVEERSPSGWLLLAPRLDILLFNRVIGAGVEAPLERGRLRDLLERYRAAGVDNFGVPLSPAAQPPEIVDWLADEGLRPSDRWSKVCRAAGRVAALPTDLRIERAGREHSTAVARITCAAFGMPPLLESWIASMVGRDGWHHYLAWDREEAVATAALFVTGDVGWLGIAGTLPSARRRGAQIALMARRIHDGADLGCRRFVTETGEDVPGRPNPSFHNMQRAGFQAAYHRPNFVPGKAS